RIDSQPGPGLVYGVAERLTELVDHRGRDVQLTRGIRFHFIAGSFVSRAFVLHFFLEHTNTVEQTFWPWWTTRDINVHGDDGVDSLHHCVVVEHPARRRARAHGDAPLGRRLLLGDEANERRQLERKEARAAHAGGLTR